VLLQSRDDVAPTAKPKGHAVNPLLLKRIEQLMTTEEFIFRQERLRIGITNYGITGITELR
jgi:hypothetical protein